MASKYLSVTQVLSKYQNWSAVNPDRLELACERGSAVDNYCNNYALGFYAVPPVGLEGYCVSFETWFKANVIEVVAVQPHLVNETFGFVGHPDLIALLKGDERPTVIDNKTPDAAHPIWSAQCSAYLDLAMDKYRPRRCGSLRLRKDGSPAIFKEYTDSVQDFQAFLSALFAHRYFLGKE